MLLTLYAVYAKANMFSTFFFVAKSSERVLARSVCPAYSNNFWQPRPLLH